MASDQTLVTTPRCNLCGNNSVVELTAEEVAALNTGGHIQDTLAHRPAEFRELLISGTHEHCWEAMFGADEDEDY